MFGAGGFSGKNGGNYGGGGGGSQDISGAGASGMVLVEW